MTAEARPRAQGATPVAAVRPCTDTVGSGGPKAVSLQLVPELGTAAAGGAEAQAKAEESSG